MKLFIFLTCTLIGTSTYSQQITIDTLANAVADVNTFNAIPIQVATKSGGLYGGGFNFVYTEDGKPLPAEFVRIDYNNKKATYKQLPSVLSGNGAFWMGALDADGNAY